MHILYVANERRAAAVAARALHSTVPECKVTWAQTLNSARSWLHANRDVAAVIVEAEVQGQACTTFVEQVRGAGLTTPLVIVAPEHAAAMPAAVHAGADAYISDGASLEAELPRVLTATIDRERLRQATVERTVAEAGEALAEAEARLARADEARDQMEQRYAGELAAATSRLADLEAQHTRALARETRICGALQQRLIDLETALETVQERRAAEAIESANQLAKRQAEFAAGLAEVAHARDALARKLTAAAAAIESEQQARRTEVAEAAAVRTALLGELTEARSAYHLLQQRAVADLVAATDRETALQQRLTQETGARTTLEQKLGAAEAARQDADQRYATELTDAARRLADVQARFDAALTENAAARAGFQQQLIDAAAALQRASQEREADAAAADAHLAQREAELGVVLAEAYAAKTTLEGALTDAKAAHQQALRRAAAELAAAGEREAALEDLLAQEADVRAALEQKLVAAQAARQESEERHATEVTALAIRLAEFEARHDAAVTEHATVRARFEQQLAQAATALERAIQQHASESAAAAAHLARLEADFASRLAKAAAEKTALESALMQAEALHRRVHQRASADLTAATEREAALADRLAGESAARTALERDLGESRRDAATARRRLLHVICEHRRRAREYQTRIEAQLTGERAESQGLLARRADEITQARGERDTLQHLLGTTREQVQRLHTAMEQERAGYERARAASDSELQRLSAESDQLRQSLDHLRKAFQAVEQIAREHAVERARLESVVAERDGELSAQAARHVAAERAAQDALSQSQDKLRQTLERTSSEITRLEREITGLRDQLQTTQSRAAALRLDAERLPAVQAELEDTRRERRREFERAPYGLCQCTRDGVITHANHSLVRLLGYRRADDMIGMTVAAAGFEYPDDVRWLIERAVSTGKTEAVEAVWKRRGRHRLVVRIQALVTRSDAVAVVVEDVTNVRALEERLRQAGRLESVARLAAEMAVTCESVLRDAARDGEQWLAAIGRDSELRHQGERLLADVRRAATVLQRFAAYGNRQMSAVEPTSVARVVRDLEPVMKRIVSDDVELVFAPLSPSLDVDVDAERLERIFVNVAYYARERMPHGGQVRIEAASTVVGRRFTAKYPHARPGPHVLITIAERPRPERQKLPLDIAATEEPPREARPASDSPGLEIGALLELVVNSGGHLWMEAQPAGGMVLKIHLPKRAGDDGSEEPPAAPSDSGRFARWFRTKSAVIAGS